jgi:hypothetical protein
VCCIRGGSSATRGTGFQPVLAQQTRATRLISDRNMEGGFPIQRFSRCEFLVASDVLAIAPTMRIRAYIANNPPRWADAQNISRAVSAEGGRVRNPPYGPLICALPPEKGTAWTSGIARREFTGLGLFGHLRAR